MAVNKEALLKAKFGIEEVEVPGVGTVEIRPLSRSEALALYGKEMDVAEMERQLISKAMTNPSLTEDEVKEWQDVAPAGQIQPVIEAIVTASGMEQHAAKAAYADFRGKPGA